METILSKATRRNGNKNSGQIKADMMKAGNDLLIVIFRAMMVEVQQARHQQTGK